MASTQQHIIIEDILDDVVYLKNGSYSIVLETSAVNFDLLSENEQLAIISSFAGLLNSLSFPIQILIRSTRLDITSYLNLLTKAEGKQLNPLLRKMMERYRVFVETIIRENEVLDKQFYVVITVTALELGVVGELAKKRQKALTILQPRVSHIIGQLGRVGLIAEQLTSEKLAKLFYDIYNEDDRLMVEDQAAQESQPVAVQAQVPIPQNPSTQPVNLTSNPQIPSTQPNPYPNPTLATRDIPTQAPPSIPVAQKTQPMFQQTNRQNPFVVEELPDEYGAR